MGGCDERVKELWHYKTTFGSVWFNVASTLLSTMQILTTCVLLGYYHTSVSIEYLWWPIFECTRLFILTIARMDVMLKHVSEYRSNPRAFEQTRRILMLCNLIGVASIIVGAPVFLFLLPDHSSKLYTAFVTSVPIFMFIRLLLSLPMIVIILCGTSIYRSHDGNAYERIGDFPTDVNRGSSSGSSNQGNEEENRSARRSSRHSSRVSQDLLYSMLEQRQMELAMEESRRQNFQNLRSRQDEEYEAAIREQQHLDAIPASSVTTSNENIIVPMESNQPSYQHPPPTSEPQPQQETPPMAETIVTTATVQKAIPDDPLQQQPHISLPDLPSEPPKSDDVVSVRIRLPNGSRSVRFFNGNDSVGDIKLWVNHELVSQACNHICHQFRLISTMPRVVYEDDNQTLADLGFWRPNAKRQLQTPVLYVEEFAE